MKKTISLLVLLTLSMAVAWSQNQTDRQGRRQGHWSKLDAAGHKIYEGTFRDGLETGTFVYYYPNGNVKIKNEYIVDGRYCRHQAFDEEGHLIATGFYNQKNRDSVWHYFANDGRVVKIASYRMGIKQGKHVVFTSKGDTAEVCYWFDNRRHGRWWKRIGTSGYITGTYRNGRLEGTIFEYDDNHRLIRKGNYLDGEKNGSYQYFDASGLIVDEKWHTGTMAERRIRLSRQGKSEMISIYNIAYFLARGTKCQLITREGVSTRYDDSWEEVFSRAGNELFVVVDKKNLVAANTNCLHGLTKDAEGRDVLRLDPDPGFSIFVDDDSRKLIESLSRPPELDK